MARTETVWDGGLQEYHEVDGPRPLTPVERERRRRAMAKYIAETGATVREVASIWGIHNCNVYRALAGLLGSPYDEVHEVWRDNKAVSLERANAARKAKSYRTVGGNHGDTDLPPDHG